MALFVDGKALRVALYEGAATSSSFRAAVAYWGKGVAQELGLFGMDDVRLTCDLMGGGTNPFAVQAMVEAGLGVRHLAGLHAKVYVLDGLASVGSSNASSNGLSATHDAGLIEANLITGPDDPAFAQASAFVDACWTKGAPVVQADLDMAKARWLAHVDPDPLQTGSSNEGRRFMERARAIADFLAYYVGDEGDLTEGTTYAFGRRDVVRKALSGGTSEFDASLPAHVELRVAMALLTKALRKAGIERDEIYSKNVERARGSSGYDGTSYVPTPLARMVKAFMDSDAA